MPATSHPQAKFDPISPALDLHSLVEEVPNLKWAQRVSRTQLRNLGPLEFEKLVLMHVIVGGKPLVIDGLDAVLPRWLFNVEWLEKNYDKKEERVRDIVSQSDVPMTTGHYLRSMRQLTNQWNATNFRDERRQRLYLKDIDCPPEWREGLQKVINPILFYLNNSISSPTSGSLDEDGNEKIEEAAAPAGDLMSSLPKEMRAENLMCYIGHEGTYTPSHREMCASLGQNIMVEASGQDNGEKPGSSIWFMTESKDRAVVREYFLSMLGHDIEIEKHFAQINAWKKAPFDVYIVEQRVGDFILVPPLAAHQVWNRGTRTIKVAWNRTTVETLELALQEALPKARLVCRDEQYKNKAMIYYTLKSYYRRLVSLEKNAEKAQISFINLGQDVTRTSPRAKQLASDFKKLFVLFTGILVDEVFAFKEKDVEFIPFDSCITCSYCRANIFNRFLTCKHCVRTLPSGDEDTYDVCMECYAMGRSCVCISGLYWCEQWSWSELVNNHEIWRSMVINNDGFIDVNTSPQPLEVVRQMSGKKTVAQICQEALRRRPWKDITQPERPPTPSDSDEQDDKMNASAKKSKKRKRKKGDVRRCHVCCHKDFSYRVQMCSNPDCSEGYCFGVLYRAFDMMPQEVLENENWICPKCLGICNCGYCRRTGCTTPYMPKNTMLGHDTRSIADDRSVEALVDFRLHNLAWLKAAGEESRGDNTQRMQRLREQADTAKAEGLSNEQPEDETAEADNHEPPQELLAHAQNGVANGVTHGDMPITVMDHGEPAPSLPAPWLHDEAFLTGQNGDLLAYPDPSVFAARRIGLGYYEQDDAADKILFDPYQAPTAEALRAEEDDIPDFVKKSIRSAKRKARKENEDPEFIIKSRQRKRMRTQETDFLDSMDPALFNEAPAVVDAPQSQDDSLSNIDSAAVGQIGDAAPSMKNNPRYEPLLRHAKPRTSYIEVEDIDVEDPDDAVQLVGLSVNEDNERGSLEAAPVAAVADDNNNNNDDDNGLWSTFETDDKAEAASTESLTNKKKRGRLPKRAGQKSTKSAETKSSGQATQMTSSDEADSAESHHYDDYLAGHTPVVRRGRGRPRGSGAGARNASGRSSMGKAGNVHSNVSQATGKRPRGRPRRISVGSTRVPDRKPAAAAEPSFMSLAERMAARGKKVTIAKKSERWSESATRRGGDSDDGEDDYDGEDGSEKTARKKLENMTIQLPGFRAINESSARSMADEKAGGSTVVRLDMDEFEDFTMDNGSMTDLGSGLGLGSGSDSSDNDDIPAKIGSTAVASRVGRGRPRGRPAMRSRGRGRGRGRG